jgi:uncharacterized protein YeeX (DUF496 family)
VPEKDSEKKKPDPMRIFVLRNLPQEIKESLTKEEVEAFLYGDLWPDSLKEKLKDYMVEEDQS